MARNVEIKVDHRMRDVRGHSGERADVQRERIVPGRFVLGDVGQILPEDRAIVPEPIAEVDEKENCHPGSTHQPVLRQQLQVVAVCVNGIRLELRPPVKTSIVDVRSRAGAEHRVDAELIQRGLPIVDPDVQSVLLQLLRDHAEPLL